jgi:hypothetical protein
VQLRYRLDHMKRRGECAWDLVEDANKRRNPSGYDRAMSLLADLECLDEPQ